jgi:hypothetical protein
VLFNCQNTLKRFLWKLQPYKLWAEGSKQGILSTLHIN